MRFETSQHMRLGQQMKLAPRMIQSMEILQMPLLQLEERIAQELESNVTLELGENGENADGSTTDLIEGGGSDAGHLNDGPDAREEALTIDEGSAKDDFARLESFEQSNPDIIENEYSETSPASTVSDRLDRLSDYRQSSGSGGDPDAKAEAMANTQSRPESLIEQLLEQWALVDVEPSLRRPGEMIIAFIDEVGYLRTDLETIVDKTPGLSPAERPSPETMARALRAVQLLLEPPGVAARDTRECLLLQIDALMEQTSPAQSAAREEWALVRRLVADHLDDLAQNRLPKIAEKVGRPMADVKQAMERMRHLSLAPARQLVSESPGVIVPDAIVEYDPDQDRYIAYLNDSRNQALRINQEYALLAKDKTAPASTKEFIRKNLSNAAWLIDAVEQRKRTILRVIKVVVDAQREYFDYGPQALKPLPMTQVAEQLGVHVATVSRAVADKHLLTPRGIVPLRSFFSGGTQTESGEEMSWDAIKAALKDIIDAEDKSAPLSDDALASELSKRGIEIARRTVAKYRDQLGVPSARLRKQF